MARAVVPVHRRDIYCPVLASSLLHGRAKASCDRGQIGLRLLPKRWPRGSSPWPDSPHEAHQVQDLGVQIRNGRGADLRLDDVFHHQKPGHVQCQAEFEGLASAVLQKAQILDHGIKIGCEESIAT